MTKLFEKLREMEQRAMPAPWFPGSIIGRLDSPDPYEFIAELRNAAPKMLQVIDVLTEALEQYKKEGPYNDDHQCMIHIADVALVKARAISNE